MTAKQLLYLHECQSLTGLPPAYRVLPDNRGLWVYAMAYGNGRLCEGEIGCVGYDSGWCYKSVDAAFQAADEWDGSGEPNGWKKNIQTQEYRKEFE